MNDKQTRRTPGQKAGNALPSLFRHSCRRYRFLYHGFVLSADVGNFLDAAGAALLALGGKPFLP